MHLLAREICDPAAAWARLSGGLPHGRETDRALDRGEGPAPGRQFLARVRKSLGSTQAGFVRRPSLFWWNHSDAALLATAWTGVALSAVVVCGWSNALVLAALWLLYMSFVHAGQDWYGYGWEVQLLETGFLAIFLARSWMAGRLRGVRRLSSFYGCSDG